MTIKEALYKSKELLKEVSSENYIESLLLMSHLLKVDLKSIFLMEEEDLDRERESLFFDYVRRRMRGYPIPYITKRKSFMSLEFAIDEGVFIPRPETETLVEIAVAQACGKKLFLDVGCGSGVISISLLYYCKELCGVAVDVSEKAIEITRINAKKFGVEDRLTLYNLDFMDLQKESSFDFIISNPPYVASYRLKNLLYEPPVALDGGPDGFRIYPSLIEKSFEMLKTGGFILLEIDPPIANKVEKELKKYFKDVKILKDLSCLERYAYGRK